MPILVLINGPNNVHLACNNVSVLLDLIKSLQRSSMVQNFKNL